MWLLLHKAIQFDGLSHLFGNISTAFRFSIISTPMHCVIHLFSSSHAQRLPHCLLELFLKIQPALVEPVFINTLICSTVAFTMNQALYCHALFHSSRQVLILVPVNE